MELKRIKEAEKNVRNYFKEGLIKKEKNETAKDMYLKNADLSLSLAEECKDSELRPYIWVVVISYYSMFYIANAVLLELGHKVQDKIVHKVTNEALIVLVTDKIKNSLIEEYEDAREDAFQIASVKSEEIIEFYGMEMSKKARFQYNMSESAHKQKAETSLKRAKQFALEMKK